MSAFQSPPHCEPVGYPRNTGTVLFPNPWRATCMDGRVGAELTRTFVGLSVEAWRAHLGIED